MNNKLLSTHLNNLSPECKWFLIMFLVEFKETNNVTQTVAEFNVKLGVSKNVITSSLNHLVAVGALKRKPFKTEKQGFLNAYEILITTESVTEIFPSSGKNFIPPSLNLHKKLIELLYTNERNQSRLSKLKLANRLLLSVLLSYADACGVVRGIGLADLMKLTCMSKDRLQSQLEKLKTQGYIRKSVSGVTGRFLFGTAKGLHWLNLKHENYNNQAYSGDIVVIPMNSISEGERGESDSIYEFSSWICKDRQNKVSSTNQKIESVKRHLSAEKYRIVTEKYSQDYYNEFGAIASYFQDTEESRVRKYFQIKLYDYASYILSNDCFPLSEEKSMYDNDLMNIIYKDILPKNLYLKACSTSLDAEFIKDKLVSFIFSVAMDIAIKIKLQLEPLSNLNFGDLTFTILPPSAVSNKEPTFITLEMFNNGSDKNDPRIHWIKLRDASITDSLISTLSVEEKYEYGLLTRLRKHKGRWPVREVNVQ